MGWRHTTHKFGQNKPCFEIIFMCDFVKPIDIHPTPSRPPAPSCVPRCQISSGAACHQEEMHGALLYICPFRIIAATNAVTTGNELNRSMNNEGHGQGATATNSTATSATVVRLFCFLLDGGGWYRCITHPGGNYSTTTYYTVGKKSRRNVPHHQTGNPLGADRTATC